MKILVLSQCWYPENGVHQRRWTWLSKILTDAGHHVTAVVPPPHYPGGQLLSGWEKSTVEYGAAGERILRTSFFPHSEKLVSRALDQAIVSSTSVTTALLTFLNRNVEKPDLIIGTVPSLPTAIVTRLIAKALGVPYVIDLRDAWPDLLKYSDRWDESLRVRGGGTSNLKFRAGSLVAKVTSDQILGSLQNASGIIVTTDSLREHLLNSSVHTSLPPSHVATVRNVFPHVLPEVKPPLIPEENTLRVVYAGTLGRAQNLRSTIRAARLLQDEGKHIHFHFIGGGAAKKRLQAAAEDGNINAEFLSRVSPEELSSHYAWADTALVNLASWNPMSLTVPSKLYELMALGHHISGGINGEPADIVSSLGAGHVANADDPKGLAEIWSRIIDDRSLLSVDSRGGDWVETQRNSIAPAQFLALVENVLS